MTRDGQTLRDYGGHQGTETNWAAYAACPRCDAMGGEACWDLKYKHSAPQHCWKPHPCRLLVSIFDSVNQEEEMDRMATRRYTDHELEARRALNWVSHPNQNRTGRARWNQKAPCKSNKHLITVAETNHPYGRSTHSSSYLTHMLTGILFAWQDGKFKLAQARWRCGARTHDFILLDEPTSVLCPACKIERIPLEQQRSERYG